MSKPEHHHSQFSSLKYKWDIQNSLDTYPSKIGIEKGEKNKQRQTILKMFKKGYSIEELTIEQVQQIIRGTV